MSRQMEKALVKMDKLKENIVLAADRAVLDIQEELEGEKQTLVIGIYFAMATEGRKFEVWMKENI